MLHANKYTPTMPNTEDMKSLQYPVFNVDHSSKFAELEKKIFDLKKLEGPVYTITRDHHFNEIDKHVQLVKQMNLPVREGVDPHHLFGDLQWVHVILFLVNIFHLRSFSSSQCFECLPSSSRQVLIFDQIIFSVMSSRNYLLKSFYFL